MRPFTKYRCDYCVKHFHTANDVGEFRLVFSGAEFKVCSEECRNRIIEINSDPDFIRKDTIPSQMLVKWVDPRRTNKSMANWGRPAPRRVIGRG